MSDIEEDQEFVSTDHDHLISSITKLDKTQHISEPTRNEPTIHNSEFNLIKNSNKLDLTKAVEVLKDTTRHAKIKKKLKTTQDRSTVLSKPLEKPQAERIKRSTGYEDTKEKIGVWDPIVARNRTVDFVSYPLKSAPTKRQHPTDVILSNLRLKSQLEKELDEVDPRHEDEGEENNEQTFSMTYEEMLEKRKQMAKMRAQQSYQAAKAKRQSKIKSKKYHRILKKERLKQQLKEFEDLQIKDPEEALKKLEELEKARALERHTLRHKNTGKWAKSKLVRAKYDKEVRQQLAEQLAVSRGLTQKTQDTASTDDEEDVDERIPDITLAQDPMNPWMMKRPDKSNINEEFNFGYKKYIKDKMFKHKADSDSEGNNDDEVENSDLTVLKNTILKLRNISNEEEGNVEEDAIVTEPSKDNDVDTIKITRKKKNEKKRKNDSLVTGEKKLKRTAVSTSTWIVDEIDTQNDNKNTRKDAPDVTEVFDELEAKIANKVDKKLTNLRKYIEKFEAPKKMNKTSETKSKTESYLNKLEFKKSNPKPIIDEALIETTSRDINSVPQAEKSIKNIIPDVVVPKPENTRSTESENKNSNIDPSRFIEVKPQYLNTALSKGENDLDELDDDDEQIVPKVDIEEVFEEDDVVASFRQEKQDEINSSKPKEIDLTLPGWGAWGGKGVKVVKRKRNRFISKVIPDFPRRDENKGDIIINEIKMPQVDAHKVSELPFPFKSVADYEASIRVPIGNTFIPETAHKKLIKPNVITKAGTIIEPMDEDQLLFKCNLTFKNEKIINILAKK